MKSIVASSPGRAILIGNPFDIYGGSTIALTLPFLRSYVYLSECDKQRIQSRCYQPEDHRFDPDIKLEGALIEELDLQYKNFHLKDVSDIPFESGFARSTAAVIAMIRAFNRLYNLGITNNYEIAELAWKIERKLGVCGGTERFVIAHDDKEIEEDKIRERLEKENLIINRSMPGRLFFTDLEGRENHFNKTKVEVKELSWPKNFKLGAAFFLNKLNSFQIHKHMKILFDNDQEAKNIILQHRDIARKKTKEALEEFKKAAPDPNIIGKLMTDSFNLRINLSRILNLKNVLDQRVLNLKEKIENKTYGVNQPGSKSIIFLYEDDSIFECFEEEKDLQIIKIQR